MGTLNREQTELLKKIGLTEPSDRLMMLPMKFYTGLSDVQFTIFWNLPSHIKIGIPTKLILKYVKDRAKRLNLIESDRSGFNLHETKINGKDKRI